MKIKYLCKIHRFEACYTESDSEFDAVLADMRRNEMDVSLTRDQVGASCPM